MQLPALPISEGKFGSAERVSEFRQVGKSPDTLRVHAAERQRSGRLGCSIRIAIAAEVVPVYLILERWPGHSQETSSLGTIPLSEAQSFHDNGLLGERGEIIRDGFLGMRNQVLPGEVP